MKELVIGLEVEKRSEEILEKSHLRCKRGERSGKA